MPLKEFFLDYFTPALEEDELLVEVEVPNMPSGSAAAYRKETVTSGDYPDSLRSRIYWSRQKTAHYKTGPDSPGSGGRYPIYAQEASQAMIGKNRNCQIGGRSRRYCQGRSSACLRYPRLRGPQEAVGRRINQEIVSLAIERAEKT